jgi:hypothetical protein
MSHTRSNTRAFNVDVPIVSDPGEPMWKRYAVRGVTASQARETAVAMAKDDGYIVDEPARRVNANWSE